MAIKLRTVLPGKQRHVRNHLNTVAVIVAVHVGIGIDIETAEQVTKKKYVPSDTRGHVGLNNVYRRLVSYYKDVDITFSSIPFFENKVTIILPAGPFTDFSERSFYEP